MKERFLDRSQGCQKALAAFSERGRMAHFSCFAMSWCARGYIVGPITDKNEAQGEAEGEVQAGLSRSFLYEEESH
jgi:hypothetical protein